MEIQTKLDDKSLLISTLHYCVVEKSESNNNNNIKMTNTNTTTIPVSKNKKVLKNVILREKQWFYSIKNECSRV